MYSRRKSMIRARRHRDQCAGESNRRNRAGGDRIGSDGDGMSCLRADVSYERDMAGRVTLWLQACTVWCDGSDRRPRSQLLAKDGLSRSRNMDSRFPRPRRHEIKKTGVWRFSR